MTTKMNCVQQPVSNCFSSIGRFIGRHPWYFVAIPFVLTIILSTGVMRIDVRRSVEYLYAPTNSKLMENKQKVISLFPMNTSEYFDLGRVPDTVMFTVVIIQAKDRGNILRGEIMDEVMELDTTIRGLKVETDGMNVTYEDVCAKKREACIKNDAEVVANKVTEYERNKKKTKLRIQYPIYINKLTSEFIFYGLFLGDVEVDFEGYATSVKAIRLFYFMDNSDKKHFDRATEWETKVSNMLETIERRNITFTWFSKTSYALETTKVTRKISLFLVISLVAIIVLMFAINMSRQWTQSKPWMSLAFVLCVILAMASGLGLGMYCGIKFATMVIFDLFLLLGIGMNDTFVLISSWRRTDRKDSVSNRLAQTYAESFVPITVTFLIALICFGIGVTIPFRAAQIFCAYSALTSLFFYLYEITFLGGCLAIGGYREEKNLHPIACCATVSSSSDKVTTSHNSLCRENAAKPEVNYLISGIFGKTYVSVVSNIWCRFGILIIYVAYIVVAALQCTKLGITSGVTDIFPTNCHLVSYYQDHYKYFTTYPHRVQLVIDTPLDYSDPIVQEQVEDLLQSLENSTFIEKKLTSCWLRIYKMYRKRLAWMISDLSFIEGLTLSFLGIPAAADIATDIIFNENETAIDTMRCAVQTYKIHDADAEKNMLNELERIVGESELPVTYSSMLFPSYDLHRIIIDIVLWILPVTAGVVLTVFTLLVPSLIGVLVGTLSTVSIQVGVIGFLSLWDVKVNSFFAVMTVMIIGLSVNYVCHFTYAYMTSTEEVHRDRLAYAMKYFGSIILQTSLILIIACALLMLVRNTLLVIFYKIIFLVFVFGTLHALLFVPAVYFTVDSGVRHYSRRFFPDTHELGKVQNSDYCERIGVKRGTNV